jgi:hypothetical protein
MFDQRKRRGATRLHRRWFGATEGRSDRSDEWHRPPWLAARVRERCRLVWRATVGPRGGIFDRGRDISRRRHRVTADRWSFFIGGRNERAAPIGLSDLLCFGLRRPAVERPFARRRKLWRDQRLRHGTGPERAVDEAAEKIRHQLAISR